MILIAPIFEGRVIKRVLIFRSPPFPPPPPGPDMKILFELTQFLNGCI